MSKYQDRIKCAAIYFQQTSDTNGSIRGGTSGIGIGSGGVGVMAGGFNGRISSETQSRLADMFEPIKNQSTGNDLAMNNLISSLLCSIIALCAPSMVIQMLSNGGDILSENTVLAITSIFYLISGFSFLGFLMALKKGPQNVPMLFTDSEMENIKRNYDRAYYSPTEHVIFIDEDESYVANKENFKTLLLKST